MSQLDRDSDSRIVYIELKSGFNDDGPARIGRVTFSKSGRSVYYQGRRFERIKGGGELRRRRDRGGVLDLRRKAWRERPPLGGFGSSGGGRRRAGGVRGAPGSAVSPVLGAVEPAFAGRPPRSAFSAPKAVPYRVPADRPRLGAAAESPPVMCTSPPPLPG